MLILGKDTEDKDCIFNPTTDTKNYLIGFFGFFPHSLHDRFYDFLDSLEIQGIAGQENVCYSEFNLNGQYAVEVYNCCDRRTFDSTIILPYSFKTKQEALDWFDCKIAESKILSKKDFCDIEAIDGDNFLQHIREIIDYKLKKEFISDIIKYELNNMILELDNKLSEEYEHDSDYIKIIKLKIKDYQKHIERL